MRYGERLSVLKKITKGDSIVNSVSKNKVTSNNRGINKKKETAETFDKSAFNLPSHISSDKDLMEVLLHITLEHSKEKEGCFGDVYRIYSLDIEDYFKKEKNEMTQKITQIEQEDKEKKAQRKKNVFQLREYGQSCYNKKTLSDIKISTSVFKDLLTIQETEPTFDVCNSISNRHQLEEDRYSYAVSLATQGNYCKNLENLKEALINAEKSLNFFKKDASKNFTNQNFSNKGLLSPADYLINRGEQLISIIKNSILHLCSE